MVNSRLLYVKENTNFHEFDMNYKKENILLGKKAEGLTRTQAGVQPLMKKVTHYFLKIYG